MAVASTPPSLEPESPERHLALAVEAFQLPPPLVVLQPQRELLELEASSNPRQFLHLPPVLQVKLAMAIPLEQASLWEKLVALVILWACLAVGLAQAVVFQPRIGWC